MSDRSRGRVVVVTGASSGIGRSLALQLVRRGVRVVAAARSEDKLRQLSAEAGPSLVAMPVDVADEGAVGALAKEVERRCGAAHAVVNNAAIGHLAPFLESTAGDWREIIDINLIGALQVTQAFLPAMLAAGRGAIVNVGSSGAAGWPYLTLYSATKAALQAATIALDREYAGCGVRVLSVEIGPTHGTGFGSRFRKADHVAAATRAWTELGIDWNRPVAPEASAQRVVAAIEAVFDSQTGRHGGGT